MGGGVSFSINDAIEAVLGLVVRKGIGTCVAEFGFGVLNDDDAARGFTDLPEVRFVIVEDPGAGEAGRFGCDEEAGEGGQGEESEKSSGHDLR